MRFNVRYYTENILGPDRECCILASKESSKWKIYAFRVGSVHALSGLTFYSLGDELRSLDYLESRYLEDFYIEWEISIPNLNYLYNIVKEWEEAGQFRLSDYYDIPWYDGGNSA